ncbi:MAG: DUF2811 domain-containing protein [Cyanobacteriota bacterium]|nr:DUF2811 domain-containing protein [Cyanobacteriota bacterium]
MTTDPPAKASEEMAGHQCETLRAEQARRIDNATSRPGVCLEAEVPEALFKGMREFIRCHPQWDHSSVITSALAGFLFQNGAGETCVKDHYLAALFADF